MEKEKIIPVLQASFIGILADAVYQYGQEGVIDTVTARRKKAQLLNGERNAAFYGLSSLEEVFTVFCEYFDNTKWNIEKTEKGFIAKTKACKLCAMTKKLEAPSPCNIYCLHALEGMVKGIAPHSEYTVHSTLWNSPSCTVEVILK